MRRRSVVVALLACVAVAVMTGRLRPTNDDSYTHPSPDGPTIFRVDPRFTTTTTVLP